MNDTKTSCGATSWLCVPALIVMVPITLVGCIAMGTWFVLDRLERLGWKEPR